MLLRVLVHISRTPNYPFFRIRTIDRHCLHNVRMRTIDYVDIPVSI
jgi:hypothetical protein